MCHLAVGQHNVLVVKEMVPAQLRPRFRMQVVKIHFCGVRGTVAHGGGLSEARHEVRGSEKRELWVHGAQFEPHLEKSHVQALAHGQAVPKEARLYHV